MSVCRPFGKAVLALLIAKLSNCLCRTLLHLPTCMPTKDRVLPALILSQVNEPVKDTSQCNSYQSPLTGWPILHTVGFMNETLNKASNLSDCSNSTVHHLCLPLHIKSKSLIPFVKLDLPLCIYSLSLLTPTNMYFFSRH